MHLQQIFVNTIACLVPIFVKSVFTITLLILKTRNLNHCQRFKEEMEKFQSITDIKL